MSDFKFVEGATVLTIHADGAGFRFEDTPVTEAISSWNTIKPLYVEWRPKEDITAYELAMLLPFLLRRDYIQREDLPTDERLLRHLNVKEQD